MRRTNLRLESLEDRCLLAATVSEIPIPGPSISLEGITTGPDGNLWYTSFNNGRIGRVTPAGNVTEFEASSTPNSGPVGITAAPDGNLWYTLKNVNKIGRITPAGAVTEFTAGTASASGPEGITVGPDGNVWFTQRFAGRIGRLTLDGVLTEIVTPTQLSQPTSITLGADGNLWFTAYAANFIGRVTPSGQVAEYALPTENAGPFAIINGPDGNLWFTERNANQIGRINIFGKITEFAVPTPNGHPVGITPGSDGNVWFTERNGGKISQISPTGQITEIAVLTPNAQPYAIAIGPRRDLLFTQLGATGNRVGVVSGIVSDAQGFVQALYRKALGRFASPSELDGWGQVVARTNTWMVANAIERSHEARTRLVKGWYVKYLGRVPGPGEEQYWVRLMLGGITEEQVLSGILGSQEYFNRTAQILGVRGGSTDEQFVRALFRQVLGRDASDGEVANIRANFLTKYGRHGTAWTILNSDEHRSNMIGGYYRNLLGRGGAPGAGEVRAWVQARPWLDLTTIRTGFEASAEFYQKG